MSITCNNSILSLKNININNNYKENQINFNRSSFLEKNYVHNNLNIKNEHLFLLGDEINNLDENNIPSSIEELKVIDFPNANEIPLDLNFSPLFFSQSTKPIDCDKINQKINNFNNSKQNESIIDKALLNDLNNKNYNLIN